MSAHPDMVMTTEEIKSAARQNLRRWMAAGPSAHAKGDRIIELQDFLSIQLGVLTCRDVETKPDAIKLYLYSLKDEQKA